MSDPFFNFNDPVEMLQPDGSWAKALYVRRLSSADAAYPHLVYNPRTRDVYWRESDGIRAAAVDDRAFRAKCVDGTWVRGVEVDFDKWNFIPTIHKEKAIMFDSRFRALFDGDTDYVLHPVDDDEDDDPSESPLPPSAERVIAAAEQLANCLQLEIKDGWHALHNACLAVRSAVESWKGEKA